MKLKQKILSLAIALSLTGSVVPTSAFADTSATQTATFTGTCSHGNHEGYTELSAALSENRYQNGDYHLSGGKYYLSNDLTVSNTIYILDEDVEICLNGHTLTVAGNANGFYVGSNNDLKPLSFSIANGKIVSDLKPSEYDNFIFMNIGKIVYKLKNVDFTSVNGTTISGILYSNNGYINIIENCVFENMSSNGKLIWTDSSTSIINTKINNIKVATHVIALSGKSHIIDGLTVENTDTTSVIIASGDNFENIVIQNCDFGTIANEAENGCELIEIDNCKEKAEISNTKIHDIKNGNCPVINAIVLRKCAKAIIKDTQIYNINCTYVHDFQAVDIISSNSEISGLKVYNVPDKQSLFSRGIFYNTYAGGSNTFTAVLSNSEISVPTKNFVEIVGDVNVSLNDGSYIGKTNASASGNLTVYGGNFSEKIPENWLAKNKTVVSTGNKTYPYRVETIVHKGEYSSDANGHWIAKCTECGKSSDKEPHISNDGKITKQPTTTSTGTKTYTCKVCGYVIKTEEIEKLPIIPPTVSTIDEKNTWADTAKRIEKNTAGHEEIINMNGLTTVPAEVIKAIAASDSKATFVVDDMFSRTIDGSKICETAACDFSVIKAEVTAENTPRGTVGSSFTVNDTSVKSQLNINFDKSHAKEFANLYKKVDGKLVFTDNVKVDENGAASGLEVSDKGEYVVMLGEFSDRAGDMDNDGITNAKDALAALKDAIGLAKGANPLVSDMNNDGTINAKDALIILKIYLGIY